MLSARVVLKALRPRFVDQRPFILSHLLTARCNADCVTCLWKMPAPGPGSRVCAAYLSGRCRGRQYGAVAPQRRPVAGNRGVRETTRRSRVLPGHERDRLRVCRARDQPGNAAAGCRGKGADRPADRFAVSTGLLGSPGFKEFLTRAEACNRCRDVGVVEISHMWDGRVEAICSAIKNLA